MCGKERLNCVPFNSSSRGSHGQFCKSLFPIVFLETFRRIMSRRDALPFSAQVRFLLDREENLCGNRSPENRHPVNSVGMMHFNWPGAVTFPLKDVVVCKNPFSAAPVSKSLQGSGDDHFAGNNLNNKKQHPGLLFQSFADRGGVIRRCNFQHFVTLRSDLRTASFPLSQRSFLLSLMISFGGKGRNEAVATIN